MADLQAHTIYALPLPSSPAPSRVARKRKRKPLRVPPSDEDEREQSNTEYSAVITPEERAQRRLAGHPLDVPPPPAPFPHAPQSDASSIFNDTITDNGDRALSISSPLSSSLRTQHLAVMTAILHRCLEEKEYTRATKAIAMILRTEVSGRSIDVRHAGLWGAGAEILARNHAFDHGISRDGLDKVRTFYERLALQHPWHRSWPNTINAQDFKLAMFDLWIYTVHVESRRIRDQSIENDESLTSDDRELQAKRWELGEANAISKEMDSLMGSVPFIDHFELIRLRAMIALWTADLIDTVELLSIDADSETGPQETMLHETQSANVDDLQEVSTKQPNDKAIASRSLAERLFTKLGMVDNGTLAQEEESSEADVIY